MERNNFQLKFILDKLSIVQNENIQNHNQPLINDLENLQPEANLPTPNNPPWNSLMAFLVWIASVLFIAIVPSFGLLIYLATQGVNLSDSSKLMDSIQSDPYSLLINILGVIPAHILTILLAWLIVTYGNKYSFREMLGWEWGGFGILTLVGIVVGFFIVSALVTQVLPQEENDVIRLLRSSRSAVFVVAFMATFTAPLVEEVVYRGILYSAFQRTFGVPIAVFFVTLLFAAVHVPQYYPSYATIFVICLLSLVITLVRVKSNNLLPCIILHTIFNGVQSALLIAEPYLRQDFPEDQPQSAFFFWLN